MKTLITFIAILGCANQLLATEISRSFELRVISDDEKANGATGFKGSSSVFNNEDRLEYLKNYAEYAKTFFSDPNLDTVTTTDEEVTGALKKLKAQPLPEVRERISLNEWRWHGYKKGQHESSMARIDAWKARPGVTVKNEALVVTSKEVALDINLDGQPWRFFTEFRLKPSRKEGLRSFEITSDAGQRLLSVGIDPSGRIFYTTGGKMKQGPACDAMEWHTFKLEVDLINPEHLALNDYVEVGDVSRYNLYVDEALVADYVPLDAPGIMNANTLTLTCLKGDVIDDFRGVGYSLRADWEKEYPYAIQTYLDEDFSYKQDVSGWAESGYDDSGWTLANLPIVHGGERYQEEHLYLRKVIKLGKFEEAILNIETMDPSGELWVNGQRIKQVSNREPQKINLTDVLKPGKKNLIAIRIDPFEVAEEDKMKHLTTDKHIGWFAGRMSLDLRRKTFIDDVYISTESIGEVATMKVRVALVNDDSAKGSPVEVKARLTHWYPEESNDTAAESATWVTLAAGDSTEVNLELKVAAPELWTFRTPNLYKLQVTLSRDGEAIDDAVVTTGIRTVSQEGGTFRINGKPETMRAPLVFGYRPPLDKVSTWNRSGPDEWLMREILMIKNMNGNGARMSVHHGKKLSINDPRWTEMADQVGFMWIWGTTPWVREGGVGDADHWAGLEKYVRQVYNHPSIVIWQPTNHPSFKDWDDAMSFYKLIHGTIYPIDSSRLISPTGDLRRIHEHGDYSDDGTTDFKGNPKDQPADPIWTAPMITRGSMDTPTGYGREWSVLSAWPKPTQWQGGAFMQTHLDSKVRAYFNFEQEESTGQPNWNLRKGKPHYRVHSYEWKYDKGSIGTRLSCDQWQESQAWQAFSAYEAIRNMRWMDYDGFSWCCLHGGPNTATYQKPLIDFYGHVKLAWYTNKMAFQDVLAGSRNVDMVYGPGDTIPLVVLNLGEQKTVDVEAVAKTLGGVEIDRKMFNKITLPAGRTVTELGDWKPDLAADEYVVFEYRVILTGSEMEK